MFLSLFFPTNVWSQKSYCSCENGVSLTNNNVYHLSFQGKKGRDKSGLKNYAKEKELSKNQIWLFFDPPSSGRIKLLFDSTDKAFTTYVFMQSLEDICADFNSHRAQLIYSEKNPKNIEKTQLYIEQGLRYAIVLAGKSKVKDSVSLNILFSPQDIEGNEIVDSLMFDLTKPSKHKKYWLHIRNSVNHKPVKGTISFDGSNEIDGAYVASDLVMNLSRNIKICELNIDAEGYFSFDQEDYKIILGDNGFRDTVYLKPLVRGMVAKIDEIYFAAGLPDILEESLPKLNRLRDFLLVNPTVNIEIQGHVNGDGTKKMKSKKLSKKRAKRILFYLVDAGISHDRLSAKGYGFTKPVFDSPQNEMEKETNRRVEILIK
tara:strand:- start:1992 stop:3113 length:1122 start_codon:yes stop_codon:yes gene_type:complete